jgi:hypothetical protein
MIEKDTLRVILAIIVILGIWAFLDGIGDNDVATKPDIEIFHPESLHYPGVPHYYADSHHWSEV